MTNLKGAVLAYKISDLCYTYGINKPAATEVLKDINLEIPEGDLVAIMGASGSGKSTLMHLLSGMATLQTGTILLSGIDLGQCKKAELSKLRNEKIGFVFQQFYLLARLSVIDNILLPTLYPLANKSDFDADSKRAEASAHQLDIAHRLSHYPNELSGGEQQRTVIARALIKGADIILADEPTGNLDSNNTQQVLSLLKDLNDRGKTVIIVTHDPEVASIAKRIIHIKDGAIIEDIRKEQPTVKLAKSTLKPPKKTLLSWMKKLTHLAVDNLLRKKSQSLLTALGVTIGIASIMVMMTLGQFTKERILASYTQLGVKTVSFTGSPNLRLSATEKMRMSFSGFSMPYDLDVLKDLFPSIKALSPVIRSYGEIGYPGERGLMQGVILGVNQYYLPIIDIKPVSGKNISEFDLSRRSSVCIIGHTIKEKIFGSQHPIGKMVLFEQQGRLGNCTVIGTLMRQSSNGGGSYNNPNTHLILPYTFLRLVSPWYAQHIRQFLITVSSIHDIKPLGQGIANYFNDKYGRSGLFSIDPKTLLLQNIRTFLNIFTMMLATISLVSLIVAGIGITNMMLASISERLHEIGLRKAVGATEKDMYQLFLLEAIILSLISGLIGLTLGFMTYEGIIYIASKFVKTIPFTWLFSPLAITLSLSSILIVGLLSGLAPARRARDLDVIKCLEG